MSLSAGRGMALIRIGFGLYFLVQGIAKVSSGWLAAPDGMMQLVGSSLERGQAEGFYRPFLEGTVVPNAALFSQVTHGEVGHGPPLLVAYTSERT